MTTPTTTPQTNFPDYLPGPRPGGRPPVGLFAASRRYWPIVLLFVLLLGAAGGAWAFRRSPTYTAEARVSAMHLQVDNIVALPGVLDATEAVSTLYSRAVTADAVTGPVARRAGVNQRYVASHVSATPLADAPIIRVSATGTSAAQAIRLANGAADSLVTYVNRRSGAAFNDNALLRRYRARQERAERLQQVVKDARKALQASDTPSNRRALERASADAGEAQIKVDAVEAAYQSAEQSRRQAPTAQKLTSATTATSDRTSVAQTAIFIGVLAGLAIGLAVAGQLGARRQRRLTLG